MFLCRSYGWPGPTNWWPMVMPFQGPPNRVKPSLGNSLCSQERRTNTPLFGCKGVRPGTVADSMCGFSPLAFETHDWNADLEKAHVTYNGQEVLGAEGSILARLIPALPPRGVVVTQATLPHVDGLTSEARWDPSLVRLDGRGRRLVCHASTGRGVGDLDAPRCPGHQRVTPRPGCRHPRRSRYRSGM